jgi:hypothetical protein
VLRTAQAFRLIGRIGGGDRTHRGGRRRRWWPTEHLPVKIGDAVGADSRRSWCGRSSTPRPWPGRTRRIRSAASDFPVSRTLTLAGRE